MEEIKTIKKDDKFRVTMRMNKEIVDWYKAKADSYSIAYTSYMALLLTNIYEQEQAKELTKSFNANMAMMGNMSDGSMSAEDMIKAMQKLVAAAADIDADPKGE